MNKILAVLLGVIVLVAAATIYFTIGSSKTAYLSPDNQQYQTPVVTNVSTSAQEILKYSGIDLTPFQSQLDSAPSDIVNLQSP